jgi:hypothetical protein
VLSAQNPTSFSVEKREDLIANTVTGDSLSEGVRRIDTTQSIESVRISTERMNRDNVYRWLLILGRELSHSDSQLMPFD